MTCYAAGSGMGTSGLVGQFMTYASMKADGIDTKIIIAEIIVMHVIAPAIITIGISEFMRKKKLIKFGEMSLDNLN